jgi:hypothetical protein
MRLDWAFALVDLGFLMGPVHRHVRARSYRDCDREADELVDPFPGHASYLLQVSLCYYRAHCQSLSLTKSRRKIRQRTHLQHGACGRCSKLRRLASTCRDDV